MNDSRKLDESPSLTRYVRQFRRVARLAAADPLRLLPPDPLTRLASLSAPITALVDVAPFERLRETLDAPAPAPRRVHRTRLQHFIGGDAVVRTGPAPVAAVPPRDTAAGDAGRVAAGQARSSRPASHMARGPEPLHREAKSATTLAERRAALRRANAGPGSPSRPASRGAQVDAGAGPGHTKFDNRRDAPAGGQLAALPFEPGLSEREETAGSMDVPLGPDELHRAAHQPLSTDERQAVPRRNAAVDGPSAAAPFGSPPVDVVARTTARNGHLDPSPATSERGASSHLSSLSPTLAQTTPPADASVTRRRRASEPSSELDLADALFETLYRDGVDLSWP